MGERALGPATPGHPPVSPAFSFFHGQGTHKHGVVRYAPPVQSVQGGDESGSCPGGEKWPGTGNPRGGAGF